MQLQSTYYKPAITKLQIEKKHVQPISFKQALTKDTLEITPVESKQYRVYLEKLRGFFPQPTIKNNGDRTLIRSMNKTLKGLARLKKEDKSYLGTYEPVNYKEAKKAVMPEKMSSVDEGVNTVVKYFNGLSNWNHPKTVANVVPSPTIVSAAASTVSALQNPNIIWDEYSHNIAKAEVEVSAIMANLFGWDSDKAVGIFTFGGTGCNLYGAKIGITKAQPESKTKGNINKVKNYRFRHSTL